MGLGAGIPGDGGRPGGARRRGHAAVGAAHGPRPRWAAGRTRRDRRGGSQVGFVVVAGRGPRTAMFLREFAPTQAVIAIVLLIAGSAVASLAIFRPARRRLRDLERVAEALGTGDLSARAADAGGDEVAALAHAFNRMAGDLEARTSAMEASDRTRRQLLADVSHELKTPLAAIRGYVETLGMPELPLDDDTRRRYLDIVGEETIKLEQIVGDLLDLARLEGGGVTLAPEAVPVEKLFQRVNDRHERDLIEKQITLDTSVASGAAEVWADAGAARAGAAEPRGQRGPAHARGRAHRARGRGRRRRASASSCTTAGPGIAPEHLPRIFDRFYKTDVVAQRPALEDRQRPRPVDREGHRRAARRPRGRGERRRRRRGVLHRVAAPARCNRADPNRQAPCRTRTWTDPDPRAQDGRITPPSGNRTTFRVTCADTRRTPIRGAALTERETCAGSRRDRPACHRGVAVTSEQRLQSCSQGPGARAPGCRWP